MPLARETFTFKFSNIPQSLVCKQHLSILQLFSLSEAVRIKPSHAQREGGGAGGQDTVRPPNCKALPKMKDALTGEQRGIDPTPSQTLKDQTTKKSLS